MQTAIKALQEVDPLAMRRQTALSRSRSVLIGVSDPGTASVEGHSFQKHEVSIESNLPLLSLLSGAEISDLEKNIGDCGRAYFSSEKSCMYHLGPLVEK